jgi:hypothetical protein
MGAFGGLILTNKGRNLQTKAQVGIALNFTKIKIGDGSLAGQSVLELNNLIREKKTLDILGIQVVTGGQAKIKGYLTNQDIMSGFYWREIGVFAMDPDEGEILYCYGNASTNAEYIPSSGGSEVIERFINVITLVGSSSNVTATLGSEVYVTRQELDEVLEQIEDGSQLEEHLSSSMPHIFADGGNQYRWGLSVVNGVVRMNYEEVS